MTPDRYEPSPACRRRLSGYLQRRSSKLGVPTWGGFLFGGVFVAVGTAIILVGTRILAVDPASVHAPYLVLTVAGVSFALGGFMVWGMAWQQFAANRQRKEAARLHPNEPALEDYPWHPDGFEVSEWPGAAKAVGLAIGLTVFLSMFNWWAFAAGGPWMVKGIVGVFDLIAVLLWCKAGQQVLSALNYELPADAQPTQLSADKPVFWELEVGLDLPGLDFKETYLVPIYNSATACPIKPILLNAGARS